MMAERDAEEERELLEAQLAAARALLQQHVLEQAEIEDALRQSEERYRSLIERAAYGIFRAAPDGTLLDVNPALVRMLGYPDAAALLRANLPRDIHLDPDEGTHIAALVESGALDEWIETRWKRRDGMPISVRLSLRAVRDARGRTIACEGIAEDVTERRRQDELLRRSERLASIGTTLAGVAHELNNPLAAVIGFAQLLLARPLPPEERSALETILHEAERTAKIVRDLLTVARQRETVHRAPVDLNDVVGYISRTRRYALETSGIACTLDLDPALPRVLGDRAQIEQLVLNLLVNAEQALAGADDRPRHPAPEIRIRTAQDAGRVLLELGDNGPGIPEELLSRIWDPFWTTKPEGEGSGLGLSVVHGIVSGHGGTVEASSTVGMGASFVVRLPALRALRMHPERGDGAAHPAARVLDVLAVDADAAALSFLTRFLTSRGHAVLAAQDAARGEALAERLSFDAVIVDVRSVPSTSTYVERLRALPGCARARFVVAGAGGDAALAEATRDIPTWDAARIAKPYDVDELRRLIEGT